MSEHVDETIRDRADSYAQQFYVVWLDSLGIEFPQDDIAGEDPANFIIDVLTDNFQEAIEEGRDQAFGKCRVCKKSLKEPSGLCSVAHVDVTYYHGAKDALEEAGISEDEKEKILDTVMENVREK